jgi:hypothetical protein
VAARHQIDGAVLALGRQPTAQRPGNVRVVNDPDEEREPDRVGPKIAAGLTVAGAGVLLRPGAAVALGAASPLFESLAERAWEELGPTRGDGPDRC